MKKVFLVILSVALMITGCENIDFGDTNKNVNGPSEANTATLLSGAMTNFATRTGRPYRITPTLNVQYFMQLVYNDEMLYANTPGYWSSYYVQTSSNLKQVIDICSEPEAAADINITNNGDLGNQIAIAQIFKALIMKRTTDLFGDIPYNASLSVESLTPEYDSQEDVYDALIKEVVAARDMINTDTDLVPVTGDAIYGGDMEAWVKFANSFLMQMAMQLSKAGSTVIDAPAVFAEALGHSGGVIETLADEAWYTFESANGFYNPWNWMRPADYGVTQELISSMKGAGTNKVTSNTTLDERLQLVVANTADEGLPYGFLDYGDGTPAAINPVLLLADTHLPILTAGYTYLNRAEAADLGWTTEDADAMLTAGIAASYARFDAMYNDGTYTISDGSAYAAARLANITGSVTRAQVIGEEKWIALYPLGYDAWSEHRRTDWPKLTPAADALNDGNMPTRYMYPSEESSLNTANYEAGVAGLTPAEDKNTAKVWWDK